MSTEENIFMARVAEQAERFDDMVTYLTKVIVEKESKDFNAEERNLFSVGFKNQISNQRTAIRTINAIKENPKYAKYEAGLSAYKSKIEKELNDICENIISVVKNNCIGKNQDKEIEAFFLKLVADYYRYAAENASEATIGHLKNGAAEYYDKAYTICTEHL
jgi:14-3-3 protein epsilon